MSDSVYKAAIQPNAKNQNKPDRVLVRRKSPLRNFSGKGPKIAVEIKGRPSIQRPGALSGEALNARPEFQRFLSYGKTYAENTPPPPPEPQITQTPGNGAPNPNSPTAKANRTITSRRTVFGPKAHSQTAMTQKNNQGK